MVTKDDLQKSFLATIKRNKMNKQISAILDQSYTQNRNLLTHIQTLVLGVSSELDAFFKNEDEGLILLAAIYRYLIIQNANVHNPDKYSKDISLDSEERTLHATFKRQDELIGLKEDIKKVIKDVFDIDLAYFEKNGSTGIYVKICY